MRPLFDTTPPRLEDYEYLRFLTPSRLAWEYLRRNSEYCRDWRISTPGRPQPRLLKTGVTLLQARRRFLTAEAWGLWLFCRSVA